MKDELFNSFLYPKPGLLTLSSVYVPTHKHRKHLLCKRLLPLAWLVIVCMKSFATYMMKKYGARAGIKCTLCSARVTWTCMFTHPPSAASLLVVCTARICLWRFLHVHSIISAKMCVSKVFTMTQNKTRLNFYANEKLKDICTINMIRNEVMLGFVSN